MKKFLCLALCFVFLLSLTACKRKVADPTVVDLTPETTEVEESDPEDVVRINIPIGLIDAQYHDNLDKYVQENGYISAKKKSNGTVTIRMRSLTHALLLTKIGMKIMREMGAIVDSGDYPYAVRLGKYNEDFSEIVMLVKTEEYQQSPDATNLPYMLAQCGLYYQLYTTEKNRECKVIIADHETNKIVYEHTYTEEEVNIKY